MTRCAALVATVFCVAVPLSAGGQTASDPLRLALECSTRGSELTFRFTLQNVSEVPTAAVIGMIFGNDKKYEPDRLELTVRRAGAADTTLTYVDTSSGVVAGRLDPWLVELPAGAAYYVVVRAANFRLSPNLAKEPFSTPADVQLRLTTREVGRLNPDVQGLGLINVWIGILTSDWIRVPTECSRPQ